MFIDVPAVLEQDPKMFYASRATSKMIDDDANDKR
jgi:hypothetical protein